MIEATLRACTVLMVDDDPNVLRQYGRLLQQMGLRVLAATDGSMGLGFLAKERVDVILTDLNMPVMGGLEFLRAVREVDLDVPIILMTGAPELKSAMAAVDYGAFQYLTKPTSPDQLKVTIAQASQFHALARLQRLTVPLNGGAPAGLRDRASLEARFDKAMEQLFIAFQPIVRYAVRSVFSYEALVRTHERSLANPQALFSVAGQLGRTAELGRRIRQEVSLAASDLPPGELLFVNLDPSDLDDEELYADASSLSALAPRVVFEITERSELSEVSGLRAKLNKLRSRNFRIAIDDLGAGYSNLSSFIHLEPDYVKLDMSLIRDVHLSAAKLSLGRGIARICMGDLGIQVICEGVEVVDEVETLAAEGLDLLQGYYFARPGHDFPRPVFEALPTLRAPRSTGS